MPQVIDNLIALRVLTMLVKPFSETDAFKLGIIDNKGKNLIKSSSLSTSEQKSAYTFLHRLVFNMKKIINKLPGGESKLKSLVSAYFLIREYYEKNERSTSMMEHKFNKLMETDALLAEELILVEKFIKSLEEEGEGGGAPANATGAMTSTDAATTPVLKKKDIDKYKKTNTGAVSMARRNNKVF
jgi:hypothetical protein